MLILLLAGLFIWSEGKGQTPNARAVQDSLLLIEKSNETFAGLRARANLHLKNRNYPAMSETADSMAAYVTKHPEPFFKARAYFWQGLNAAKQGQSATAVTNYEKAREIYLTLKDTLSALQTTGNLSNSLGRLGNSEAACEVLLESLALAEASKQPAYTAKMQDRLASTYYNLGDYTASIKYGSEALLYYETKNDTAKTCNAYNGVAMANWANKNYELALDYYAKTISLGEGRDDLEEIIHAHLKSGVLCGFLQDTLAAKKHLVDGQAYLERIGNVRPYTEFDYHRTASNVYQKLGENDASLGEALSALGTAQKFNMPVVTQRARVDILAALELFRLDVGDIPAARLQELKYLGWTEDALADSVALDIPTGRLLREKAYRLLANNRAARGRYKEAHDYRTKQLQLRDTIADLDHAEAFATLSLEFETERKDQTIALQEAELKTREQEDAIEDARNRSRIILLFGGLGVLLVIAIVIFIAYRRSQRDKLLVQARDKEKEVLLKEIHHRVKNNLQVISGLLQLQSNRSTNPEVKTLMADGQNRIKSMAMVHQMLYQNAEFGSIPFRDYLKKLLDQLAMGHGNDITLEVDADDTVLEVDSAIPLGLITNELVTNAYKHAFPDGKGTIIVSLRNLGKKRFEFEVRDNGKGLPEGMVIEKQKSTGLRLVNVLSQQLAGTLTVQRGQGTRVVIAFEERPGSR